MAAQNLVHDDSAPTSITTAFTATSITQIWEGTAANETGGAITLDVIIGDGTTDVVVVKALSVAAGSYEAIPINNKVLNVGWTIKLNASAADLQVSISGATA